MGETEGGKAVFEGSEAEWDGWKGRKRRVARLGSDWDRTVLLVEAYTHVEEHALRMLSMRKFWKVTPFTRMLSPLFYEETEQTDFSYLFLG